MRLRFTPRATENIAAAADYIRPRNPAGAARVRAAIYRSLQNLPLFPEMGRLQKRAGVRKLVTGKYHYIIYYTIDRDADEIVILNVKHPAQMRDPDSAWLTLIVLLCGGDKSTQAKDIMAAKALAAALEAGTWH